MTTTANPPIGVLAVPLHSSNYLARAYREGGQLAEAIPVCEETLEWCNGVLGNEHALTRKVRDNLTMTREIANSRNHHPSGSCKARRAAGYLLTGQLQPARGLGRRRGSAAR